MFDIKDTKEKLLTTLVFTGIFLPVRLVFYTYVTTWWVGSLGVVSAIMLTLIYFSKKQKLGWLGTIVMKQVVRVSKGKAGVVAIIVSVFILASFGNILYGTSNAPQTTIQEVKELLQEEGVTDLTSYTVAAKDIRWSPLELVFGIIAVLLIMVVPTDIGYSLFAIINGWTEGYFSHFITVWFVQEIELVGLVIYFRYFYKPSLVVSDH